VTFVELVATASILAILATAILPMGKLLRTRQKEMELRRALREVRDAIDAYEKMAERGMLGRQEVGTDNFPEDLETLVNGKELTGKPGTKKKFLRRIPVDPFTKKNDDWGLRCYEDDLDSDSWCGKNVYDIYTKHPGKALDGTRYRDW
jgi:general secretion pathway protein G